MATEAKLRQLADRGCPVYYFYSSERYLVRQAVSAAVRILSADTDEETTVLDGAAPEIEQLIMAAGTLSFFGTRRVVVLPELDPAAYGDKDLEELCSTLASLENAVVVLGSVFELERSKLKTGKRAQKLIAECKKLGFAEELSKPKPYELKMMLIERAKAQDTTLPEGAAAALLERCGEDPFLLENEVDKLCALSGYQTVTAAMVAEMGTVSLEADVFEMIRMITAKNATGACKKLQTLLRLQQEPIAITGAMIGSYVDLYRVKLGAAKRKNYSTVFKDFGYKGSDYRLKRSAETASHYTLGQLETCLQVLLDLDKSLKSQPVDVQTPCWKQHSAVWRWRGADDERTRTAAHRPGAGGGGQIRCRPPFPPDRCHDSADRRLWHLQGQKTPAAAESPGEKKRPDPLHRFRCRRRRSGRVDGYGVERGRGGDSQSQTGRYDHDHG